MYSTASFCNTPTELTNKQAKPNTLFVFYDEDCISRQTMFLHTTSAQPTHSPTEVTNNMARYPPLTATTWHHLVDAVSKKIEFLGPWCHPPPHCRPWTNWACETRPTISADVSYFPDKIPQFLQVWKFGVLLPPPFVDPGQIWHTRWGPWSRLPHQILQWLVYKHR